MYDDLYLNGRLLYIKFFKLMIFKKRGRKRLEEMNQRRAKLEEELVSVVSKYKDDILKEETSELIIQRKQLEQEEEEDLIEEISNLIKEL